MNSLNAGTKELLFPHTAIKLSVHRCMVKYQILHYTYAGPNFGICKNFLFACLKIGIRRESELSSEEQKDQEDSCTTFFASIELILHIAL